MNVPTTSKLMEQASTVLLWRSSTAVSFYQVVPREASRYGISKLAETLTTCTLFAP
jgi:hypothetical protein